MTTTIGRPRRLRGAATSSERGELRSPITLTATEASRGFSAILERARHGESFIVVKNGQPVAEITPPQDERNGAKLLEFLRTWEPDQSGFSEDILAAMERLDEPQARDEERMAWLDDVC